MKPMGIHNTGNYSKKYSPKNKTRRKIVSRRSKSGSA